MEEPAEDSSLQTQSLSTQENVACVKARLQEEGREARNLIAYSLPLQNRKIPSVASSNLDKPSKVSQPKEGKKLSAEVRRFKQEKRHRSASAGRDPQASLRARHWGFLFRNLEQAVDEIYQTAEDDESIIECKEAILMLERYANDFYKLIEWLKIKWEYENTSPPQRPTSLTWEIRTSSPGKILKSEKKAFLLLEARKALNFDHSSSSSSTCTAHAKNKFEAVMKFRAAKIEVESAPLIVIEGAEENKSSARDDVKTIVSLAASNSKTESGACDPPLKVSERNSSTKRRDVTPDSTNSSALVDEKIKNSSVNVLDSISESPNFVTVQEEGIINKINSPTELGHCSDASTDNHSIIVTSPASPLSLSVSTPSATNSQSATKNSTLYATKLKDSDKSPTVPNKKSTTSPIDVKEEVKRDGKKEADNNFKEETKNCADEETKNQGKEVVKNIGKEESKNTVETESRKGIEMYQPKNLHPKPGPLVNMNKASQVRKAFNQNRTPLKSHQGTLWKNTPTPQSENKSSCVKQQGVGGRLTVRRLAEGKQTQSPPLNRRFHENRFSGQRISAGSGANRGLLDRSSTSSYPGTRSLVRSSTTLEGVSYSKGHHHKFDTNEKTFYAEGKCPSNSSLASSSNTSSSGQSWADKVKGNTTARKDSVSHISLQDEDEEGWEVVRRNRRSHGGSAASLNSQGLQSVKKPHPALEKKGSVPFRMQTRFQQPSSTVSMPSLIAASDANEERVTSRDELKHSVKSDAKHERSSSQKNFFTHKANNTEAKKTNDKKRIKMNKGNSGNSSNSSISSDKSSPRISRDDTINNSAVATHGTRLKIPNCDKYRKDVANTKTQNESKLSPISKPVEDIDETTDEKSSSSMENLNFTNLPASGYPEAKTSYKSKETSCLEEKNEETKEGCTYDEESGFNINLQTESPSTSSNCQSHSMGHFKGVQNGIATDTSPLDDRDSDNESEREKEKMRCNAEAFECALEEEKRLKQQIEETERATIEVCDGMDDVEDGDANPDTDGLQVVGANAQASSPSGDSDDMDAIEKMEAVRTPGRVLHIHEKLSSPSRKLPISEKLRRHKEKLAKAQELRGKLIMAKTEKLKDLFRKIDEVNIDKERLLVEKRGLFERKMERAEEKRRCHLQEIVNKAHDEENKAKEIAFINGLEAQNKLHDIMQQHQSLESRLADMAEERCRKQEEKAAKEAAAQERRKALEAERQARMLELCEKRRKRCERIDRQQAERREELLEQAREKARDREERLSALQQAQQAKESELVKKIQQKQEETARRHEENIEQIRQKALESSIMKYSRGSDEAPKLRRYETKKMCTLCNSVITSEVYLLSHLRSRRHQEALKELHKRDVSLEESETYNLKFILNAPANIDDPQVTRDKERQKALKKRCRKIRTRMTARGKEFLEGYNTPVSKDTPFKNRMAKSLTQIGKLFSNQGSGPWPASDVALLDRHLLELLRVLEKRNEGEQNVFASLDGFRRLFRLLDLIITDDNSPCVVPARSLAFSARVMIAACKQSSENCRFLLYSNSTGSIVDQLMRRLNDMSADMARSGSSSSLNTIASLPSDPAAAAHMELLAQILQEIPVTDSSHADSEVEKANGNWPRLQDVVSYCVSMGVADKISWYFNHVQNPVENDPPSAEIILAAMSLLSTLAGKLSERSQSDDPTQLIGTFHVMDACGVVSLLYSLLLHQGGRSPSPPAASLLSPSTLAISAASTTLLHNLAELDLNMFQAILGSEGISLEFRHIASFLLWYCSHWPCEVVLHNVIALVGFFAVNNKENQSIIQSGETPSVLQQLCSLPWQYFSEPRFTSVLFPTLLACCLRNDDNLNVLQQEMSFQVLEDYLENNNSSKRPLMRRLQTSR